MPEPWEADYKPPTAAEAFDESQPLPRSALAALDYINRKDNALQAAETRVAELEAALEEAEIEVSVAAHRLHFEDVALATDRADELAELSERLRDALKGKGAK